MTIASVRPARRSHPIVSILPVVEGLKLLGRGQEHLFAAGVRSSESPMSFFKLPVNRVVEFGSQIEI